MNNLSIGKRLSLGFALALVLAASMLAISLWRLSATALAAREVMAEPLRKERLLSDWNRIVSVGVRRTAAIAKSRDGTLAAFFAEDQAESTRQGTEFQKNLEQMVAGDEEKRLFEELSKARKTYIAAREEILKLKKAEQFDEAERTLNEGFMPASKLYLASIQALLDRQRKGIDAAASDIEQQALSSRSLLMVLGLLTLVVGGLAAWWITRSITAPMERALELAQRVASGDLVERGTRDEPRTDEFGRLLNALIQMRRALSKTISGIHGAAGSINTASGEIAAGNQDLSSRTETAASNLQRTASATEELAGTVRQSADSARQAHALAGDAAGVAQRGGQVVSEVVDTMSQIRQSSSKIAEIIGVIDGIAFQTNILALNAAVEAARAGEQGRGFAVVAGEVRALAGRSAEAAKEIKTLISASVERVEQGGAQVAHAGETMQEIVASVERVRAIVGEISTAAGEQAQGLAQINAAISDLDRVTQQNAALVEDSAAAAESLREQARALVGVVSEFRVAP